MKSDDPLPIFGSTGYRNRFVRACVSAQEQAGLVMRGRDAAQKPTSERHTAGMPSDVNLQEYLSLRLR